MVATKMKKAQDLQNCRPYAMLLADIIGTIADEFEEITQFILYKDLLNIVAFLLSVSIKVLWWVKF